ncbi:MAG: hypothetical protein AAFS10_18030, partial [Myxococcota bacterium]
GDIAHIIFLDGRPQLQLFSGSWRGVALQTRWNEWITSAAQHTPVMADVLEWDLDTSIISRRYHLKDLQITMGANRIPLVTPPTEPSLYGHRAPILTHSQMASKDPSHQLMTWMTTDLAQYFKQIRKASGWKYLARWLADIHYANLYHHLPRPESRETDFFDITTFREDDFLLHVAHRAPIGSVEAVRAFVDRTIQAKKARIAFGHIGGAILVSNSFTPEALAYYNDLIQRKPQSNWFTNLQETFTGYEGFVRIGPRRGFHLLLVREDDAGTLHPILPDTNPTPS